MSGENAQANEAFGEAAVDRFLELESSTIHCHKTELDEVQVSVGLSPAALENLTDDDVGISGADSG